MHRAIVLILLLLAPFARIPVSATVYAADSRQHASKCCPLCVCGDSCACVLKPDESMPTDETPTVPASGRDDVRAVSRAIELAADEQDATDTPRFPAVTARSMRSAVSARAQTLTGSWRT